MDEIDLNELSKLIATPLAQTILEYRLYYDKNGKVITYTTEKIPGDYIVITKQQYAEARNDVIVQNNMLVKERQKITTGKLVKNKSNTDGIKTSKYDINILLSDSDTNYNFWKLKIYEL